MTYILICSLLLLLCWLIFGHRYFIYTLACLPTGVFILTQNYLYASIMILLMFFFIRTKSRESTNKKHNRFKAAIFAIAISCLPVAAYFSSNKTLYLENQSDIFIPIIFGLLVIFVAAISTIGVGMNRTKGDKNIYE